ncbi:alpha/beta hydrolase [Constantimarinum furrinae]|uniref:Alpha/beta hydrolase n=2 Tax=Constantimarinum furrinae TaxID=2562285 RepID=A0A7G8PTF4_9FLAO|nr:alpha/beta hydrolase [Constantimarinum furrinae]
MPLIDSAYRTSGLFKNAHFATVYSAKLRPMPKLLQERERITLTDGDFIDLDWSFSEKPGKKLAILLHGLEGNSKRTYIKGQGKQCVQHGWDVAAVNYRGCSGENNKVYASYNAGKTDDLEAVVNFILKKERYDEIALVGFSLGGNLLLKYLGERKSLPKQIKKGVAISTPLSLKDSLEKLSQLNNRLYHTSFLYNLKKKVRKKLQQHPEKLSRKQIKEIRTLLDFDNVYTAPAHGFKDAFDYYEKNSALQFLHKIEIPVLILNARNDTFLSDNCYPVELASNSENIYLECPKHGGHVGFHLTNHCYYSEKRTVEFLND